MTFRQDLNKELQRLKVDARRLIRERDRMTAKIDKRIKENERLQHQLNSFIDQRFGSGGKAEQGSASQLTSRGHIRQRTSRRDLPPKILAAIEANPSGIRRKGVLIALGLEHDKPAHQSVTNILRSLLKENKIRAEAREYFPVSSGPSMAASSAPAQPESSVPPAQPEPTVAPVSSTPEQSVGSSDAGGYSRDNS